MGKPVGKCDAQKQKNKYEKQTTSQIQIKWPTTLILKQYAEISWDTKPREVILGHMSSWTTMKGNML